MNKPHLKFESLRLGTEWGVKSRPACRQAGGIILKSNPAVNQQSIILTWLTDDGSANGGE